MTDVRPSKQRLDQRLRSKVGGFLLEPDSRDGGDTLAIAMCSYFERHIARPLDDTESENGWSAWAEAKMNVALDALTKALMLPDETTAFHASAPNGLKCADCTMGNGVPCPDCYAAWWRRENPHVHVIGSEFERQQIPLVQSQCCLDDPDGGLVCTLSKNHLGRHEAWGTRKNLLQTWGTEE